MGNKTTELHQIRVAVEQPNKNASYADKLKYLVKIVSPDFPSYDFILRLASFATCSKLSLEQQKKADEFISYFEKQGYFNPILYSEDENTHNFVYDFCKKHNLKRIRIEDFIHSMYECNWGFDPYDANGLKDWKDEIIKENSRIIQDGICKLRSIKGISGIDGIKDALMKMYKGDLMKERGQK